MDDDPRMSDALQIRIHGDAALPMQIYLPGLDGDWQVVAGRVRFGEFTCPTLLKGAVGNYSAAARQRFSVRAAWASAKRCGESIAQR